MEDNLNRHLANAKPWNPHDYVPWSRGPRLRASGRRGLGAARIRRLDAVAKTAMVVNLLTEDNLPRYHREIATAVRPRRRLGPWVGRWTAEEGRHGIALRDYLVVTRGVDPVELERARMEHMTAGYDSGDKTAAAGRCLRLLPGAGHPGLAPQHRRGDRVPGGRASCWPGSRPTRTCT